MIHTWSQSQVEGYLDRVEELFQEIRGMTKPSSYSYAAYQIAWSRSGRLDAPMRVESLLNEMQKDFEEGRNPRCQPKAPNFSLVINTWASCSSQESA